MLTLKIMLMGQSYSLSYVAKPNNNLYIIMHNYIHWSTLLSTHCIRYCRLLPYSYKALLKNICSMWYVFVFVLVIEYHTQE